MNKKLLCLALLAAVSAVACSPPAHAASVRFACAADLERPKGTVFSAPAGTDALPVYEAGDVVVITSLNGSEEAIKVTGPGVTVYSSKGARETRYPCQRIAPSSIPATMRTQPRQ